MDWVYGLNWGQGTAPKFSIWPEDDVDRALAERDKIISELGFQFSKSYMIKAYGFSEDDLDRKEDSASAMGMGSEFAEAPLKAAKTGVKKGVKKAFNVDEYDLDTKKLSEFGKALLTQIVNLIDDSSSFEEVRKRLFKLYPKMDTADLEDSLARAFYIAHVEGRRS